jgi:hypothetical protein
VHAAAHHEPAVGTQSDRDVRGHPHRRVEGGGHAHADQPTAIAHGAGTWVALAPAEPLGPQRVGLREHPVGVPLATDRVALGLVAHAQLDRIHAQLPGQLVHGRLHGEGAD